MDRRGAPDSCSAGCSLTCTPYLVHQSYPWTATTPLSSTLLGVALSSLVFLTLIGFALRRTNVIESAGMALFLAYNFWLCADVTDPRATEWPAFTAS